MKRLYFFGTKLYYYITLIPPLALFIICLCYHNQAEGVLKLFPLEIALVGFMLFDLVYFFRLVSVSYAEIREMGLFSSRERAMLREDKTLKITLKRRGYLQLELFGRTQNPTLIAHLGPEEGGQINEFRARALGGKGAVKRLLCYFGVDAHTAHALVQADGACALDKLRVSSMEKDGKRLVCIYFEQTI